MRIAQIAPLWERVPPFRYGGIELIVSLLTDELVRRGHEVTLFASGDSITKAHLKAVHDQALRLDKEVKEPGPFREPRYTLCKDPPHLLPAWERAMRGYTPVRR